MKGFYWILVVLGGCHVARPDWSPECPAGVDSVFLSHPFDCGSLFYCLRGVAHHVFCPLGAQWNQTLARCDYNSLARCPRSRPVGVGGESSMELERNSICPLDVGLAGPFYFIPNGSDYQRIIKCLNGVAYILSCSPGQYWNVERNRCDNLNAQEEPQAISLRNVLNRSCSVLKDLGSLELIPFFKNVGTIYVCQLDKSYVVMIVHLTDTDTTSFPSTTPTQSTPPSTPPSTSRSTSTSTSASSTPSTTTNNPNLPAPLPECSDPSSVVRFGIPGECRAYLQCHQGRAYKINCRAGREWSEAAKDCIDASLAGCSPNVPSPSTTTTARPTTTPASTARPTTAPTTCTAETQFLMHPTDCRKYIQCDNGKAIVRDCPHPLFWNMQTSNCDWMCGR